VGEEGGWEVCSVVGGELEICVLRFDAGQWSETYVDLSIAPLRVCL